MQMHLLTRCVLTTLLCVSVSHSHAGERVDEYTAREIVVLEVSATMFKQDVGLITTSTGPVGKLLPGTIIRIGDTVKVQGRQIKANLIVVKFYKQDMRWQGKLLARKGQTTCTVVASLEDLPGENERDR